MGHDNDTPRARRHDANLEKILEAALGLVADGGLEALSMARLAATVDFTPGALYRYFPSKDALLSRLVERTLEHVRTTLVATVSELPSRSSPLVRVFVLARAYRELAHREPHRFGLLAMTLAAPTILLEAPEHSAPAARAMLSALQVVRETLAAAEEGAYLDAGDTSDRTLCVFALLHGLVLMRKQTRYAPATLDVERLMTHGLRTLLIGWGASKRSVDDAIARLGTLDLAVSHSARGRA